MIKYIALMTTKKKGGEKEKKNNITKIRKKIQADCRYLRIEKE